MRELTGAWKVIAVILVGCWSIFLVYTALTIALHPLLQGGISLTFGLALVFLLYPLDQKRLSAQGRGKILYGTRNSPSWLDVFLSVIAVIPCIYIMIYWEEVARAVGRYENYQLILGVALIIVLLGVDLKKFSFLSFKIRKSCGTYPNHRHYENMSWNNCLISTFSGLSLLFFR